MAFRTYNRFSQGAKVVGILLAGAGVTILIRTLPQWFWYFVLGSGLICIGCFLYFRR